MEKTLPLNLDLFEKMVIYNALVDPIYLESIIEHARPSYFKNKDIKTVFEVLIQYYSSYNKSTKYNRIKGTFNRTRKTTSIKECCS